MSRALAGSAEMFRGAASDAGPADDIRTGFRLDLLEHESQHLGQILLYLLGLGITPPPGWKSRFAMAGVDVPAGGRVA